MPKSQMAYTDFTSIFSKVVCVCVCVCVEKTMATHSSVLAWRIPGTGEPGGLPSMGTQSRTQLKRLSSSSSVCVCVYIYAHTHIGFPSKDGKESACNAGDLGLIPGFGKIR